MKKLSKNPIVIIGGTLLILLLLFFWFVPNASAQEKPKPDSTQVYQFTILPANFNTANKILNDKFCPKDKSGTVSDTVLLQSAMNMLFSNGKAVKILNPEKEVKKISPIKK